MASDAENLWDAYAAEFDDAADHGLRDPDVRLAWDELISPFLPASPATAVDLGCGTGSLALLIAGHGLRVTGLDISTRMLDRARAKASAEGIELDLVHGDAAAPPFAPGSFDVVIARHVLWSFDDQDAVLARWTELLAPGGRLLLIEGSWSTGAGLSATECRRLVLRHRAWADVHDLAADSRLWGGQVDDERYLLFSAQ